MDLLASLSSVAEIRGEFARLENMRKIARARINKAIIPLILSFVNPMLCSGETIHSFAARVLKTGEELSLWENAVAENLAIPKGTPGRTLEVHAEETQDGAYRLGAVGINSDEIKPRAKFLIFNWILKTNQQSEAFYCVTDIKGHPKKAFVLEGKYHDGRPVRGSGITRILELDSPELRTRLQKELDFWLKGKGRKKTPAAKTAGARH